MQTQRRVLVTGAGGFIGHHLVTRLKQEGYWVRGVDIKYPEYTDVDADDERILVFIAEECVPRAWCERDEARLTDVFGFASLDGDALFDAQFFSEASKGIRSVGRLRCPELADRKRAREAFEPAHMIGMRMTPNKKIDGAMASLSEKGSDHALTHVGFVHARIKDE